MQATSLLQALGATLLDGVLAGGVALAVAALAAPTLTGPAAPKTEGLFGLLELTLRSPAILVVFAAAALVASTLLHLGAVPAFGSTLGGKLTGVRLIVRSTGAPPSAARAALRGLMSALGGVLLLAGPLWALWIDPLRRGLGDVVSGTLPIKR